MTLYKESLTKAKAVKMQLIQKLQRDLKEGGFNVPKEREALDFIVSSRYNYKRAFSSAQRAMSVAVQNASQKNC